MGQSTTALHAKKQTQFLPPGQAEGFEQVKMSDH
jgi:hypothetical protein